MNTNTPGPDAGNSVSPGSSQSVPSRINTAVSARDLALRRVHTLAKELERLIDADLLRYLSQIHPSQKGGGK